MEHLTGRAVAAEAAALFAVRGVASPVGGSMLPTEGSGWYD